MSARPLFGFLLSAVLLSLPRAGHAHAFLDHADPKVGSTVRSPPATVTLTFTEGVEPAFSKIDVIEGDGKAVAVGPLEHPDDTSLRVSMPALAAGTYRVKWRVISVDTHETEGSFTFSIQTP
jgi:copper resistance protein C